MKAVKELESADASEYRALKELCGNYGRGSLGGLPLALVQAATYMAQFKCSVAQYLNMFKNTSRMEAMQHLMKNTEELELIRESQRSISAWRN